jgi:hypothetical protein
MGGVDKPEAMMTKVQKYVLGVSQKHAFCLLT